MNNKIIITGGLGFIGSNLIRYLLKKNLKILNLDKISYCSVNSTRKIKNSNYKFKKIDLSRVKTSRLTNVIINYRPSFIINLAANSHVDNSIKNPFEFAMSNFSATLNLLVSIKNSGLLNKTKLIHIGTDEIYGEIKKKEKFFFLETSALYPSSPYSASKASCHHLVTSFSKTFNLKYKIINPSNNFGPFQFPEKLIPKTINRILKNQKVIIYKDGQNIRQWMFVQDTCIAIYKIMKLKKKNEIYNLGYGKLIKNIDLVRMIHFEIKKLAKIKKLKLKYTKDRKGHDFKYCSSNIKTSNAIRHSASNFKESIKKTILWYLNEAK